MITSKALLSQRGMHNSCGAPSYASDPQTSSIAFGYSFKESAVKQNHSPEAARRPAAARLASIVFYSYSPEGTIYCSANALSAGYRKFCSPPLI